MAFQATVCNVMIASPGDVEVERGIVRDVVYEWNAVNAANRRALLQPVGWATHSTPLMGDRPQAIINWQVLKDSDLLIAAFWTRLGTPTGDAPSGTVEEIEKHLESQKPALLYFSSAPVAPDSVDHDQYEALKKFKEECKKRGLFETYESVNEFHSKVRRHLGMTVNSHPYFVALFRPADDLQMANTSLPEPSLPSLSREARELLLTAVEGDGHILVVAWMGGAAVQAKGKNFVEPGSPRSRAIWEGAVKELVTDGLLEAIGHKGETFRITRRGYEVADLLNH